MLRAYGPNCDGSVIDPGKGQRIPDDATWIDLEEPTRDEAKLVEHCLAGLGPRDAIVDDNFARVHQLLTVQNDD